MYVYTVPNFLAPWTGFAEFESSMDWGGGWFQDDSSALHVLCTLFLLLLHQFHLRSSGLKSRRLGTPVKLIHFGVQQKLIQLWVGEWVNVTVMSNCLWPHGLYSPWSSPGQNTGVGSLSLLQWIFPTQGLNPGLPHCRQILHSLSHKGSPRILEWVAYPFSSGSSWPWNGTVVSRIAGRFFTNWAMSIVKQLYSNKIF